MKNDSIQTLPAWKPSLALEVPGSAENDYILNGESAWITVGNISVYIKKNDEGVSVDLFSKDDEFEQIAGTYALYSEAQREIA